MTELLANGGHYVHTYCGYFGADTVTGQYCNFKVHNYLFLFQFIFYFIFHHLILAANTVTRHKYLIYRILPR